MEIWQHIYVVSIILIQILGMFLRPHTQAYNMK